MKKIYQNPMTKIVKVELSKMIAASDLSGLTDDGGTMDLTETYAEDGAAAMGRGIRLWDDEE